MNSVRDSGTMTASALGSITTGDQRPAPVDRRVYVDGVDKGEVFKKGGRWYWRRGPIAVEPFRKGSKLVDVAEWARKCCNGTAASVRPTAKRGC